ncbi:MAG TPA: hypothetical protein VHC41_08115, partial [Mycobacteriales bacterium]|nr:hypothetical protein [Mycobacteriales bacterium]
MAFGGVALPRRQVSHQSWLLTLAVGAVIIAYGRIGPDWPAQEFRSWFAHNVGLHAWNNEWYAGHALLGYSVLYPPVAGTLGAGITGLLAATVVAWAGVRLFPVPEVDGPHRGGEVGRVGKLTWASIHVAVALCVLGNLVSGQVPFLLGLAPGALALLAVRSRHPYLASLLAAAASLASPLAGMFVLFIAVAWLPDLGWRRALPLGWAVCGSAVAWLIGGDSGHFPFSPASWAPYAAFTAFAIVLIPRDMRVLRRAVILTAVVAVALFVVPNPVGGNVNRLAQLAALPVSLWVLGLGAGRRWRVGWARPAVAWLAVAAAATWFAFPVMSAVVRSSGDPSRDAHFYRGLLHFLSTEDARAGRLEIPLTRGHWEVSYVAQHFPLARGWERQVDLEYNNLLYHPLDAAAYRSWLDASAVDLVALPRAPLDPGGRAERALLQHPPDYLTVAYRDKNWTVFRVDNPAPLVSGAGATLARIG